MIREEMFMEEVIYYSFIKSSSAMFSNFLPYFLTDDVLHSKLQRQTSSTYINAERYSAYAGLPDNFAQLCTEEWAHLKQLQKKVQQKSPMKSVQVKSVSCH